MPKISVCIPTYNYGQFIGEAIESVLAQTMQDFEIVITDNASQDNTREIVAAYAARDPRVRYVLNPVNIGMVPNWNRGLELATGEYVKFLCADDLLEPACLERLSLLLDSHPQASLAACARGILSGGRCSGFLSFSGKQEIIAGPECIRRMLVGGNVIGEPTAAMFRRSSVHRGFDPAFQQLPDMDFWCQLLEQGAFVFTPEVLCLYRQHDAMETRKNITSLRIYTEGRRVFRAYCTSPGVRLGTVLRIFCSLRPLLAFLYCWLYARFSATNRHIGERRRHPDGSCDKGP